MTTGKNKNLQGKNITLILFQILMFYFLIQSVFNEQSYIYIQLYSSKYGKIMVIILFLIILLLPLISFILSVILYIIIFIVKPKIQSHILT